MPTIHKSKYGYTCKCSKHWGAGHTRAIAFQEWQKISKENPTVREDRERNLDRQGGIGGHSKV